MKIMKKAAAIGNILFTYLIALLPVLLFTYGKTGVSTFLWEHLFLGNVFVPLGFTLLFGIVMYIVNIFVIIKASRGRWSVRELARTNMLIKIIQIPAYVVIFIIGLLCCLMIFTIGISLALLLLDLFSIGLTGLFACAAFYRLRKEQLISSNMQMLCSLASFLFCADVVIAVIGYRASLPAKSSPEQEFPS